jgi:predicted enzyme related to lactoylglutathione lyase
MPKRQATESDMSSFVPDKSKANGGEVVSPIISIAAGRFAYCLDRDGNSFGLYV